MTKIILFFLILFSFVKCSVENSKVEDFDKNVTDSIISILSDTTKKDTLSKTEQLEILIESTKNSDRKIKEIKTIKKENTCLKKELIQTKDELKIVKEQVRTLDSVLKDNDEKKKKGFLKKVIDNIKGNNDTIK